MNWYITANMDGIDWTELSIIMQRSGMGAMMENLLAQLPKRSVMLVSTHGNEGFYQKLGFRRLRTAYILQEDFEPWHEMGYLDKQEENIING